MLPCVRFLHSPAPDSQFHSLLDYFSLVADVASLIYNGFLVEGTRELADVLSVNYTLLTLNYQFNNIGDEGCGLLAEALRINTSLTSLNLSNNNIGPRGVRSLADMLRFNTSLETLLLQYNTLGDPGARLLAEVLALGHVRLREIDVAGNGICEQGARDLAEALTLNQSLQFLGYSDNKPLNAGVCQMAVALHDNVVLRALDLHGCGLSDTGAAALGDALRFNGTLTGLSLDSNDIADDGLMALAEGLRTKVTALRHLDLRHNRFGERGTVAVADALRFNNSLKQLLGVDLLPLAAGVLRLSSSELRSCGLLETGEAGRDGGGREHGDEDEVNALLLAALRRRREFARLRHELGKEVQWPGRQK